MKRREFIRNAVIAGSTIGFPFSRALADESGLFRNSENASRSGGRTAGLNPRVTGLKCLRCKKRYPVDSGHADSGTGCPECLALGYPANVTFTYLPITKDLFEGKGAGLTRYQNLLPMLDFPQLGEGNTPLMPIPALAQKLGLTKVFLKDESRGPTGSHKDRMSGLIVARAAQLKKPGIVISSSGNGGHSIAAYSGSAGVVATVLSTKYLSAPWKQAVESTEAILKIVETSEERWKVAKEMVEKEGWYSATNYLPNPVGSNPFSNQGCKTVAYEIVHQLAGSQVDSVLVPTCRGDLLWGVYEGFADALEAGLIARIPRLFAVEPYPRLELILKGLDYRTLFTPPSHSMGSIGGKTSAYQALSALELSNGGAASVTNDEAIRARNELANHGYYLELSSAAALAGLYTLVKNKVIASNERVIMIGTSHGYKDLKG